MNTNKVWVVDDDHDDLFLIRAAFEQAAPPVGVLTLNDGEELLPRLKKEPAAPQLVLLDLNMVRQNGLETLREVRSVAEWQNLPIIVFTTSSEEIHRQQALSLGATDFMTKPTRFAQLKELVQQLTDEWKLAK